MKIKEGPVLGSAVRETRTRDLSITSPTPIGYRVWLYCRSMKKTRQRFINRKSTFFWQLAGLCCARRIGANCYRKWSPLRTRMRCSPAGRVPSTSSAPTRSLPRSSAASRDGSRTDYCRSSFTIPDRRLGVTYPKSRHTADGHCLGYRVGPKAQVKSSRDGHGSELLDPIRSDPHCK